MYQIILIIIVFVFQFIYVPLAHAKEAGSTAFNFLKIGAGPRAIGMGGAFTAVADDASAIYWNPAGLVNLNRYEASFSHMKWLEKTSYQNINFVRSLREYGALGFAIAHLSQDDIQGYDSGGVPTSSSLEFADTALTISYAYPLPVRSFHASAGLNAKYIKETIADEKTSAIAFDAGLLTTFDHVFLNLPLSVGLSLKNIGPSVTYIEGSYALPSIITIGAASRVYYDKMILSLDYTIPNDNDSCIIPGLEYILTEWCALRAGYQAVLASENDDVGNSVRFGFGLGNTDMHIDYAFVPYGILGDTHRFGVTVQFGSAFRYDAYTKRIDNHMSEALRSYVNKDLALAQKEVSLVLTLDPAHQEALELMNKITAGKNQINIERHLKYVDKLIKQNKLLEAQEECVYIRTIEPGNLELSNRIDRINQQLGQEKTNRIQALFTQAEEFYNKEAYQDALELWNKILLIQPGHAPSIEKQTLAREKLAVQKETQNRMQIDRLYARAARAVADKKWDEAVLLLEDILKQNPQYPQAPELFATAQKNLSALQREKAESIIQEGIQYYRTDQMEKAYESFSKALKICPNHETGIQYHAKVKTLLDALHKQQAQELNKKGLQAYSEGKLKESIGYFEKALKICPAYEEAQNNLKRAQQEYHP